MSHRITSSKWASDCGSWPYGLVHACSNTEHKTHESYAPRPKTSRHCRDVLSDLTHPRLRQTKTIPNHKPIHLHLHLYPLYVRRYMFLSEYLNMWLSAWICVYIYMFIYLYLLSIAPYISLVQRLGLLPAPPDPQSLFLRVGCFVTGMARHGI